jgi:hypothetical protein
MDEPNLDRQLLDAIPHFIFLVDEDVRILAYNAAGATLEAIKTEEHNAMVEQIVAHAWGLAC